MKKTIYLAIFVVMFLILVPVASLAQSCSGSCSSGGCPPNTILLSGTCPSGQVCCSGALTNPNSVGNTPSTTQSGGSQSSGFGNPITPNTIEDVLKNIMNYLQLIAGTIATIFIIIGGVMYMMSIGDKDMLERAKKTLIFAIAGLAIVVAAPYFYKEIKAIFEGGSPGSALQQILANVLKLLLSVVGFLAIISLIIGSIWMFTAVGDDEKYALGKKTATYSITGLIIVVGALIIINQVIALIRG